ncbi:hypothetical protein RRG08_060007 [Elysia crispata]|uniref:Uncharacterized protein n=1 Tax=Elysia crispata TaxID=231223 RepID=A0AAE0YDT8_9GAST|nr:hypothetical protein RRG08_060007 [Elysia crispata]
MSDRIKVEKEIGRAGMVGYTTHYSDMSLRQESHPRHDLLNTVTTCVESTFKEMRVEKINDRPAAARGARLAPHERRHLTWNPHLLDKTRALQVSGEYAIYSTGKGEKRDFSAL